MDLTEAEKMIVEIALNTEIKSLEKKLARGFDSMRAKAAAESALAAARSALAKVGAKPE